MISTNWIMGLLIDVFGRDVTRRSKLRTKYVAPIHENQIVAACAKVTGVTRNETGATTVDLDVWCEDDARKKLTVGSATVVRPPL